MNFWDANFLKNIRFFHFRFFYFAIVEYVNSIHISKCSFIWLQAPSDKVCRVKNQKNCEIFVIFVFLSFLDPREAVKQFCDS